jgi:hypothetical protein
VLLYDVGVLCVGCALIDMLVKGSGDVNLAYKVFEKMPEKNAVAWTLMSEQIYAHAVKLGLLLACMRGLAIQLTTPTTRKS